LFLLKQIQTSRNEVANSSIKEKERGRARAGRAFHAINTGAAEIRRFSPKTENSSKDFTKKVWNPTKQKELNKHRSLPGALGLSLPNEILVDIFLHVSAPFDPSAMDIPGLLERSVSAGEASPFLPCFSYTTRQFKVS